jgi:hypothetical protein
MSGKRERKCIRKAMREQCACPYFDFSGKKFVEKYSLGTARLR